MHSPKRSIRVGVVGCGEVTQIMHLPSLYQLADHFEVTALCDVSAVVLEELGKRWNVQTLTADPRELVACKDVDAVLVANPNAFHAEVTLAAIVAGKHVLVEKPMCVTRREADQIIAAQKNSNVVVQVGYMRRYAPAFLQACQAVKVMGEIKFARARAFIGQNALIINATSRVIRDENTIARLRDDAKLREEQMMEETLGESSRALKRAYSLLLGLSSHDLSAMRELLGMPSKVLFAAQRSEGGYVAATFDYGAYVCQFETGIDRIPRFDAHLEVYADEKVVRVQFNTPYVRNLPVRLVVTEANGQGGVVKTSTQPAWGDPFVEQWKAFYKNVLENAVPKTDPDDFVHDLELFAEMARLMRGH